MLAENLHLFENLELHEKLFKAVKAEGFNALTAIQSEAIPLILEGRDLMASAETGSGKTLAFILPILQLLLNEPPNREGRGPRALILTPTRELASQITETIAKLAKFTSFRFGTITGGVAYFAQEKMLRSELDLLVATPGRLIDHMERGRVDLSRVRVLVLDEADRMLDMGFVKPLEHIVKEIKASKAMKKLIAAYQTLLFSATLEGSVKRVADQFLRNPATIQLTTSKKQHALISQWVHMADDFRHKCALLKHLLESTSVWQAIVFTATKRGADELADELYAQGIKCAALHGDMKQGQRTRTLAAVHSGKIRVLVATDVAARGLDVKKLTHVINFDLPRTGPEYVHRIGRTGRCGETGTAISLVGPKEMSLLRSIEYVTGQKLECKIIPGLEPKRKIVNAAPGRSASNNKRSFGKKSGKPGSKPKFGQKRKRFAQGGTRDK